MFSGGETVIGPVQGRREVCLLCKSAHNSSTLWFVLRKGDVSDDDEFVVENSFFSLCFSCKTQSFYSSFFFLSLYVYIRTNATIAPTILAISTM